MASNFPFFFSSSTSAPRNAAGGGGNPWKPKEMADKSTVTMTEDQVSNDSPWQVIIYDDPVNLMTYVTMVLRRIFGYDDDKARSMMLDIHKKGECVVWSGEKEKAEFYVRQLQSYQLLAAMKQAPE